MARFRNRKKKVFVKPKVKKQQQQQPNVDHITGNKIPKSFVFSRGKLPGPLRQLQMDLRKLMLPYTALKLKEKKRNNLKDFLNVAGPMGVTHFLILSKTETSPYLRVAKTPQGPTLTFKIHEYSLALDIAQSQLRPRCPQDLFKNPPLIVLSGFAAGDEHLKLTTTMFKNIFPDIDINTVKLSSCQRIVLLNYNKDTKLVDIRHYSIGLQPVGVSRRIRKFVQNHQVPDLRNLQDVSDFVTKAGYGSESEADEEAATVTLTSNLSRVNRASTKSAVKLQEIGPRMTLQLTKIEGGLCSGEVMFSEYGNGGNKKSLDSQEGNEREDCENDNKMEDSDEDNEVEDNEEDIEESEEDASVRLLTYSTPTGQYELLLSPIEPNSSSLLPDETGANHLPSEMETDASYSAMEPVEMEGRLIGRTQAGQRNMHLATSGGHENLLPSGEMGNSASVASLGMANNVSQARVSGRSSSWNCSSHSRLISSSRTGEAGYSNIMHDGSGPQPAVNVIQSELATSLAAAELPCTVKLRIWSYDMKDPHAVLDPERCRLTIPHAVLCSEMGAHFSPCGRFLAACVACVLPHLEADPGVQSQLNSDVTIAATSPTRHPISAHRVVYELRIYSLEEATFGLVLASRAIRAAHCLTSIQFSPTSEHILVAYGRRHNSLLKSVVIDGEITVPVYTILEVYRVSDMKLVRILPSAEDEVNVACFHPSVGGGLVYGTKEGKLRILQYDSSNGINHNTSSFLDENMLEVPTYALEC